MFTNNSNCCLFFFTTTSRIIPLAKTKLENINIAAHMISVGNLGTNPVAIYSIPIGKNKPIDIKQRINAIIPKKFRGLFFI